MCVATRLISCAKSGVVHVEQADLAKNIGRSVVRCFRFSRLVEAAALSQEEDLRRREEHADLKLLASSQASEKS